jgi:AraC-like DNA-binding protein
VDALSDVLETIKLSGVIFLRANLKGEFGVEMPPPTISHPTIKPPTQEHRLVMFHIVREGRGFAEVEDFSPTELSPGDLIIVFDDRFHSIVDTPGRATVPSESLVARPYPSAAPPAVHVGGEDEWDMRLVCGMLSFVDRGINPVFEALPPFLHIPAEEGPSGAWMQASLSHIIAEAESGRPGTDALLSRLTELLFVETLRGHLRGLPEDQKNWLAALNHPQIGPALQLIHADPAQAWTVAELARRVAISRSAFSSRFTEVVGLPPMAYLARWRVRRATNLLEDTSKSIAEVASAVGYESESAFNRAFKREMGTTPAAWRRSHTTGPTP